VLRTGIEQGTLNIEVKIQATLRIFLELIPAKQEVILF